MAIKHFEDKGLRPDKKVTDGRKSAIIENKEVEYCYSGRGITIKAKSKEEADQKLKDLLSK